jgi:hypothetical protein
VKLRLSKEEFVPFAPDSKGNVRINHNSSGCSGESYSLRIERKDDGTISAKCFRCGASGYYSPERRYVAPQLRTAADEEATSGARTGLALPDDCSSRFAEFPEGVRRWLAAGGITPVISESYGILWSDTTEQLYIPVVQETSAFGPKAVGWVLRRFHPKRYLTLTKDRAGFYGLLRASERHSEDELSPPPTLEKTEPLIIVEDVLSGLRCREISDTLVLCGTSLKSEALATIIQEGYKEAVIFLDADNPTVLMCARKIAKTLFWMKVQIIETGKDPKHYSKDQLRKLICSL